MINLYADDNVLNTQSFNKRLYRLLINSEPYLYSFQFLYPFTNYPHYNNVRFWKPGAFTWNQALLPWKSPPSDWMGSTMQPTTGCPSLLHLSIVSSAKTKHRLSSASFSLTKSSNGYLKYSCYLFAVINNSKFKWKFWKCHLIWRYVSYLYLGKSVAGQ